MRRAVVDVGSNSVLLVVAEKAGSIWEPVFESSAVTGLGTGVKASGKLKQDPMSRTLGAVKTAFEDAAKFGADCRAYGTMALRMATNADEFLRLADSQGTPVTVISGEDEAALGALAVMQDPCFAAFDVVSVIDPGGHSTEVTTNERTVSGPRILSSVSAAIGALGLIETAMPSERPGPQERLAASALADREFASLQPTSGQAVAVGATPVVLVSLRERMTGFDPKIVGGQTLSYEEVSRSSAWLSDLSVSERAELIGMHRGREGTIHAGALILERAMNALKVENCSVCCRGWRFALLDSEI